MGCEQSSQEKYIPPPPKPTRTMYSKPTVFFAIGCPGSNKGLYCDMLVRDYKFKLLSVKDLVTSELCKNTHLSLEIKSCLSKEIPIPSVTITKLMRKTIAIYGSIPYLIEGYPRSMQNVQSFNQLLLKEVDFKAVIFFDCSDQVMEANIKSNPRISEQNAYRIIAQYESDVLPVVRHYALKDMLVRVNTELQPTIEDNYNLVKLALQDVGMAPGQPQELFFLISQSKDMIGRTIARYYGFHYISLQSLFNTTNEKIIANMEQLVQHCQKQGKNMPITVKIKLLKRQMIKRKQAQVLLIEGYPINLEQLKEWRKVMKSNSVIKGLILNVNTEAKLKIIDPELRKDFEQKGELLLVDGRKPLKQKISVVQQYFLKFLIKPLIVRQNKPHIWFVVGTTGSGKGAICERMKKQIGFNFITIAELLKKQINEKRLNSDLIQMYISQGKVVPAEILIRLIRRYIFENLEKNELPFLLDGFPSNLKSMKCWQQQVGDQIELNSIIYFDCSKQILEERLINTKNSRNQTSQRISVRFNQYLKQTQPIIDQYKEQGLLLSVNASGSTQQVFSQIKQYIMQKNKITNNTRPLSKIETLRL